MSNDPSNRGGVSNESGYFEDEEEAGEVRENSIEIIFDKNASNNNSGNKATEGGKTGKICVLLPKILVRAAADVDSWVIAWLHLFLCLNSCATAHQASPRPPELENQKSLEV